MNIDAWIISRETSENDADNLLKILYENVIKGAEYSLQDIEIKYLKEVLNLISEGNKLKKDEIVNELFADKNMSMPKKLKTLKKIFCRLFWLFQRSIWNNEFTHCKQFSFNKLHTRL